LRSDAQRQNGGKGARLGLWLRALRLPFAGASALSYLAGVSLAGAPAPAAPDGAGVALGLVAVVAAHLCANLFNDIADTDSGVDAIDPVAHGFFGGSKVIQAGLLGRSDVLRAARLAGGVSLTAALALSLVKGSPLPVVAASAALGLALAYSLPPLRLSYRGWGEAAVGLLFGPVTVLAGHYARSGLPASSAALRLGVAVGFLVLSILLANEIPDAACDAAAGKRTLVVRVGPQRGWMLYVGAVAGGLGVLAGFFRRGSLPALAPALAAGLILASGTVVRLRRFPGDKLRLRTAALHAIMVPSTVLVILMAGRWI